MCGILGILTNNNSKIYNNIINGLEQLQNRGYDSSGICLLKNNEFYIKKFASTDEISAIEKLRNTEYNNIKNLGFDGYDVLQFLIKKVINSDIKNDVRFEALNILYSTFMIISNEIESELQIIACLTKLCKK